MPGVLLVAVGTADEYGNEQLSTQLYDTAQMTKAFVNVPGGTHLGTFLDDTPVAPERARGHRGVPRPGDSAPGPVDAATADPGARVAARMPSPTR